MTLLDKAKNITFVLFTGLIWVTLISRLFQWLSGQTWPDMYVPNISLYLFSSCILAPVLEELTFRAIPFQAMRLAEGKMTEANYLKLTWIVVAFTSIVFGLAHGNGFYSVLVQGVVGAGFAYVYLKNGYSYISAVITHALWNLACLFYNF